MKKLFTSLIIAGLALISFTAFSIPKLNSYPSAAATIFLDFDGQYVVGTIWNGGNPINCAASGLTDPQIVDAFNRVAEDYRPFEVNITTDSTVFLAAPLNQRIRVIITPTNYWNMGVGGISWMGSFTAGDDTPAFVFSNMLAYNAKYVAECCSHESGHTVGLAHQSKYDIANCSSPIETYSTGFGSGETGWAPIMGNSYSKNMTNWNNGPTPYGCTAVQDNLSTIVSNNGFGYRADDYGETLNAGTFALTGNNFNATGIITTNSDKDAFRFTLNSNSNFHVTVVPYTVPAAMNGANLDVRVELYNAAAILIRDYDPVNTMAVTIDTILNAGSYYLKVSGTGNQNIGAYGSLGEYIIAGSFNGLPIHSVSLAGTADKGKHNLSWRIVADEPIKTIEVETSNDGSHFSSLMSVSQSATNFSYQPFKNNNIFYRLKVTSVLDQTVYSNIVALKATDNAEKRFQVSNLVRNEIVVNAAENYQYTLIDINGQTIKTGTGLKGINWIDVSNLPRGINIIQIFNQDHATGSFGRQTERIIKQ
ncbi:MAG: T9SS type A sorting domain-containing protein [Chitinophagaceae bacterium]|nr:T9SS type A sorting domain-containing protein [Chitinophagaceae bacterium]